MFSLGLGECRNVEVRVYGMLRVSGTGRGGRLR